jgi:hypothetical protein
MSDWVTLGISLLALATSGVALGWQIVSWRRSGSQVTVKTTVGTAGPGLWFVGIEATNSGRLGTEVSQFGFQLPNGRHIQNIYDFLGQPVQFPMPLGPGGKASMTYAAHHLREILQQEGISGENVRPYVSTGHGRFEGDAFHLGQRIANLR